MKSWQWSLAVFAFTFIMVKVFNIPLVPFLIVFMPLSVFLLTYLSFNYSFRKSIEMERVPAKGYESRLASLDKAAADMLPLGFVKKNAFYLKTIPDSVTYILKHETLPVYLDIHNLGPRQIYVFMTFFEGGYELTTNSSASGGMIPRPPKKLTQSFENMPCDRMLDEHLKSVEFMKTKGIKAQDMPYDTLRRDFKKRYLEVSSHVKSFSFWPVRLIVWTITSRGKVHRRPIEEQYAMGIVKGF